MKLVGASPTGGSGGGTFEAMPPAWTTFARNPGTARAPLVINEQSQVLVGYERCLVGDCDVLLIRLSCASSDPHVSSLRWLFRM